ncbi:hypothetical protein P170DRAFT_47350 [Aspergillus steynii IBT 23096]|uniref:Uncharacterized protein n=1 Tax=Aspergillus steynii IBT 23096 TaxID=1392250 RepID=A0A2I2GS21_9EURO|nr:uncharacterized protein P170DRAFT_47350 [Aspergillus steynii IBT 23096]PLB55670.1 hypothetical protein P170DRAFT_47350 [Aspergillus steynii IBT 23096]
MPPRITIQMLSLSDHGLMFSCYYFLLPQEGRFCAVSRAMNMWQCVPLSSSPVSGDDRTRQVTKTKRYRRGVLRMTATKVLAAKSNAQFGFENKQWEIGCADSPSSEWPSHVVLQDEVKADTSVRHGGYRRGKREIISLPKPTGAISHDLKICLERAERPGKANIPKLSPLPSAKTGYVTCRRPNEETCSFI